MRAEILAVGSELTSGHTVNGNAAYLAQRLQTLGIPCARHTAVGDDHGAIVEALREAMARCELVVVTGGLGPTVDDTTVEAIARATGRPLALVPAVVRRIERFYRQHHRRLNRLAMRQARLPRGASALPNPAGTAPGIWLPLDRALIVALPGVPREMRAITEASILPRLRRQRRSAPILSRTIRTVGRIELEIQQILERMALPPSVRFGLYPHLQSVDVRLTVDGTRRAVAASLLDRLERQLRRRLGASVYGVDEETLESVIGRACLARRRTIAVAESCTGGLIADRITDVPGSSRYFLGGIVAYADAVKRHALGVPASTLAKHGAVSEAVATAMARGVRERIGTDIGLAVTGIAGPTGATRGKPIGLVWIAVSDRSATRATRRHFHGDRLAVKQQTAQIALDWLRRWVLEDRS